LGILLSLIGSLVKNRPITTLSTIHHQTSKPQLTIPSFIFIVQIFKLKVITIFLPPYIF
jgi:hypothetical protein